ncbi:MAG TPA: DUF6600 domain-containing protein [Methylomirabilota bacterium]|jgi:hypothetical protein
MSTVRAMRRIFSGLLALLMVLGAAPPGWAGSSSPPPPADSPAPAAPDDAPDAQEPTPPRVSYIHGEVSFWRPGAADWAPAALNMPLAPGDVLYAGPAGNVEIQIGPRAFARAAYGAQIGFDNQEPDFIQLRVTSGYAALDLRELAPGHTVELDTPGAAFTMERAGYYHAEVKADTTAFRTYRGGSAVMTPSGGTATPVAASQQVVIAGTESARVETATAPALTAWDRWNYQRSDYLAQPASARQLPAGVYGAETLDQHGSWRTVQTYGSVWVPAGVAPGWSPYTTGRWIWDPRFGWTWLDDAPWGWAPYHHGRWIFVGSYWAWAPGPIIVRPVYSPALVVFLGGPIVVGRPLYWAPLGWGEPVIRWWGRPRYVGVAWWGGWGGPRVVNNVVLSRTTTVNVTTINVYRNVNVTNAVVGVSADRFGRGAVRPVRLADAGEARRLTPVRGAVDVKPVAASVTGSAGAAATRPPDAVRARAVVATRAPHDAAPGLREQGLPAATSAAAPRPQQRIVPAPVRVTPPPAITAPGAATPAPGPARGPAGPGRVTPDAGQRARGTDRSPRQATPPDATGRVPAPARPTVTPPAPSAPAAPAPSVTAPPPRSAPPKPAAPAVRQAPAASPPPAPPAPGVQNAPPRARQGAPAERPARVEPPGKGAPERGPAERGGPERGPRDRDR